MTDTNAEPTNPAAHKWVASAPPTPRVSPTKTTAAVHPGNPALMTLNSVGFLLSAGGFIAMIVGITREAPATGGYGVTAADTMNSSLQFASTSTLIVLVGGVALLLGGMSLVGSLTVAAVKASRLTTVVSA